MTDFTKLPEDLIKYINEFISPAMRVQIICIKYGNLNEYVRKHLKDKKTLSIILFHLTHLFNGYFKGCHFQHKPLAIPSIRYNFINILTKDFIFGSKNLSTIQRLLYCIEQIIKRKYNESIYATSFKWVSGYEYRTKIIMNLMSGEIRSRN
jgi:hypothetical protein